jgi:hypothetical protein
MAAVDLKLDVTPAFAASVFLEPVMNSNKNGVQPYAASAG